MTRFCLLAAACFVIAAPAFAQDAHPGEQPVDPYEVSNANAGASPINDPKVFAAFHGEEGVKRIVANMVSQAVSDPRISEVFKATDLVRLNRTLTEQICYVLGGPCAYTGRSMAAAHKDMGLQAADMNVLVEHLQQAMDKEGVAFGQQNKLLAKLAPMKRVVVER
jgi:hemoglobin